MIATGAEAGVGLVFGNLHRYLGQLDDLMPAGFGRVGRRIGRQRAVARCGDDDAVSRVGIHWATEQCRSLLDNNVRGIHFYTLNRSDATRQIYENLGVKDSTALRKVS